jgi:predicted DNA-binding transcriptional regulator AlpA
MPSRSIAHMRTHAAFQSWTTDPTPRVPERYVSRAELARFMGVSVATIDRLVAEGMPSVTWGRRTRRFRASAAIDWAAERRRLA